jgi:hypothetical protein
MKHCFLLTLAVLPGLAMEQKPEGADLTRKQRHVAKLDAFEHECIKIIHHEVKKHIKQIQEGALPPYNFYPETLYLTLSNVAQRSHATANLERYSKFAEQAHSKEIQVSKIRNHEEKKVIEILTGTAPITPEQAPEALLEEATKKQFAANFAHLICRIMEQQDWQLHLEQFRAQAKDNGK